MHKIEATSSKITSASKQIDFFVHDMLDFNMLDDGENNFIKAMSIFDIRDAVQEIIQIQKNQAQMK